MDTIKKDMKKIIITAVSLLYVISGFCQNKVLYLKSKETLNFQTWDTIYASVRKKRVVLKDSKGNSYNLKIVTDKNGSDANIMLSEKRYHVHGSYKTYPCRDGIVLMDEKMKLYFDEKSMPFTYISSFADHGSHRSHMSHYSSRL